MTWADLRLRLRALILRERVEHELHSELDFHVEMMVRKNIARGMSRDEARRQAALRFGASAAVVEACRDERRLNIIETFFADLRYASRQLRHAPSFTAVAVLSLALGIGANTAIFSAIDALMLRPLPVRSPEQLVSFRSWFAPTGPGTWAPILPSYTAFQAMREGTNVFSDMGAVYRESRIIDGEVVRIGAVSATYFTTLGVTAIEGRTFLPDEDQDRGSHPVAVISHAYWQRHYGRAPNVVGRTFSLNGIVYTIVGITPPGFAGDEVGTSRDVWFPMTMIGQVMSDRAALARDPGQVQVSAMARLKPGVTLAQAETQVVAIYRQLADEGTAPTARAARAGVPPIRLEPHASGYAWQRTYYRKPLQILVIVVSVVLLITCANVAHLLLARSAARQRETVVRLALGASRSRILRQHLTESVLLAALAGGMGLLFAVWGTQALETLVSVGPWAVELDFAPDGRALLFTAGISALAVVLFGLGPALRASRVAISGASSTSAGRSSSASIRGVSLPRSLVTTQVALSVCLLMVAGLFVQTFRNLKFQDLGFDREDVLLVTSVRFAGIESAAVSQLYDEIQKRIESIPGVVSASPSSGSLLTGGGNALNPVTVEGYTRKPDEDTGAGWNIVVPGYFKTLGMRLFAGRDFSDSDVPGAPRVAIINETMALHYFGRRDPIGRRFGVRRDAGNEIEIVGVVKDAKYNQVREAAQKMIYFPYRQEAERLREVNLAVRTSRELPDLPARIRDILRGINPNIPIVSIEPLDQHLDRSLMLERVTADLSSAFGLLGNVLACVGLYGVISYTVARRSSEIGVRLALGARRADVLLMIVREAILPVGAGIAIGLPVSTAAATLMSTQLFGVSPVDSATAVVVVMLMIGTAGISALIPAKRAANVDPLTALRYE